MAPSQVTDSDILALWKSLDAKRLRVSVAKEKHRVGQHVRISNEKMNFAKAAKQNFSPEIFRIAK